MLIKINNTVIETNLIIYATIKHIKNFSKLKPTSKKKLFGLFNLEKDYEEEIYVVVTMNEKIIHGTSLFSVGYEHKEIRFLCKNEEEAEEILQILMIKDQEGCFDKL